MNNRDRHAADDLVHEVINKVKSGRISKSEGQEEVRATLRRFGYDSETIKYALTEYHIYS